MVATLKNRPARRTSRSRAARAIMETLENRELFSGTLLGIGAQLGLPVTSVLGNPGSLSYTAATHSFDATGAPMSIILSVSPLSAPQVLPPSSFDLHIQVDNNGNLIGSGANANDLVVTGSIDVNNDGTPDFTGTLLTGKITAFGSQDSSDPNGDQFDFRFSVTGGALAPQYFSSKDIGVTMSVEDSTFNGDFSQDFSALVKGNVGAIPQVSAPPISISGHKYIDQTGNGLTADDKSHPMSGVTINLYQDTNTDGKLDTGDTLVTSQKTAADGSYAFTGLAAATYFVTETPVSGYIETAPASGVYTVNAASGDYTGIDFDNYKSTCGCRCSCGCGPTLTTATGSLSGTVFNDCRADGKFTSGDSGIAGVKITLTGTDLLGNQISKTTYTDSHGSYSFKNLIAGNYTLSESQPSGYTDGKDSLGSLGGTLGNDIISNITLPPCADGSCYNFGEVKKTTVCGNSGHDCCKVILTGCDAWGRSCSWTTTTDCHGNYSFGNLCGGHFKIQECDSHGNCSSSKCFGIDTCNDQGKCYNLNLTCNHDHNYCGADRNSCNDDHNRNSCDNDRNSCDNDRNHNSCDDDHHASSCGDNHSKSHC
ncbi:MAG TPA: SdrD B-like domain-containing protein [Phycisphaerae bacterium]|nr:SdrD B-like domain-containing protein [Phycisphaerae bacterium]